MDSHQAAVPSSGVSRPAAPTSWTAWGSPEGASPLGRLMAGTPAELHGAQNHASPVEASPAGAGLGAVGPSSASCASSSGMTASLNSRRARLARTYSTAD